MVRETPQTLIPLFILECKWQKKKKKKRRYCNRQQRKGENQGQLQWKRKWAALNPPARHGAPCRAAAVLSEGWEPRPWPGSAERVVSGPSLLWPWSNTSRSRTESPRHLLPVEPSPSSLASTAVFFIPCPHTSAPRRGQFLVPPG